MKIITLPIVAREKVGSANSRRDRSAGRLPVNLYGMGRPTANFTVDTHSFGMSFERGNRMFELELGDEKQICLLKDIQYNSLGNQLLHADFWRIDDSKPVTINLALEFVGVPDAQSGAVVDFVARDVQINCIPRNIPEHLDVNIGSLAVGEHIEAKELELPKGATLVTVPETTIVSHHYKHAPAAEADEAAEDAEGESVEPEVLTERKPTDDA
ncbi:MAG: 50S ribosomal protein L25 [Planctomycetes bacterium]|nr:50S ribosomal protein L25 [Planctomycetota bacterium]